MEGDSKSWFALRLRDEDWGVCGGRVKGSGLDSSWRRCLSTAMTWTGLISVAFNSAVWRAKKLSKKAGDSAVEYVLGEGLCMGSPRAIASDDDVDLIPGGGGVGYAAEGAVR